MKTDTLDVAYQRAEETASYTSSAVISENWLITRISEFQKRRAHERTLHSFRRNIAAIPTHLLDDIGIDEYKVAEILVIATRSKRILTHPFLQRKG